MKEFLHRTISEEAEVTDENGDPVKLRVWRTRTSAGYRCIGIEFGQQRIEFTIGDSYEEHARIACALLEKMCESPCMLPAV